MLLKISSATYFICMHLKYLFHLFFVVNNNQQMLIPFAEQLHEETIALQDEIDKNEVCISLLFPFLGCAAA